MTGLLSLAQEIEQVFPSIVRSVCFRKHTQRDPLIFWSSFRGWQIFFRTVGQVISQNQSLCSSTETATGDKKKILCSNKTLVTKQVTYHRPFSFASAWPRGFLRRSLGILNTRFLIFYYNKVLSTGGGKKTFINFV